MKISIYITSYNQRHYLKEAIDSVLSQSLKPYEIIIVDDCSSDGSQELIRQYASNHQLIKPIFHTKNRGIADVRKSALNQVTGEFVTYLDGDDIYLPHKLEIESTLIQKSKCDFSFSNNMYVSSQDLNDVKWIWASDNLDILDQKHFFLKTLMREFPRCSLFRMELIRYSLLKKIGFHDENLNLYEDYDLRIRLSKTSIPSYSLEPTAKIRISDHGLSRSPKEKHRESFHYIFSKYREDIDQLDRTEQYKVKLRLNKLLLDLGEEKSNLPFETPVKKAKATQKIKEILKRF
ncbi:glycosyltransferase family 2 protein [Salinimicrobium soli]|uniref:glycosyltransferase family 2 protein n=1 Tax=Salinimicrobium soli TaxID=1254399 RepID=UPI003AB02E53